MKTFECQCGSTLFFHSQNCVACQQDTARCPGCRRITTIEKLPDGIWVCSECDQTLRLCANRLEHGVCNGGISAEKDGAFCSYCSLNHVIPNLDIPGNRDKWKRLEFAKHRVLYDCESLGLPIHLSEQKSGPTLQFDFKSSAADPVSTGHANGLITIDLAEADSVQREQTRVAFGEPHRTLVGHFRHELGHYYWELIVQPNYLADFRKLFGDETNPDYASSQQQYYDHGPQQNWAETFISQYASMHPWEDFAETFNGYLDMFAIVRTANHFRQQLDPRWQEDLDQLLANYIDVGVMANELNRDMGLLDLVPEVFTETVIQKLRFVHRVVRHQRQLAAEPAVS